MGRKRGVIVCPKPGSDAASEAAYREQTDTIAALISATGSDATAAEYQNQGCAVLAAWDLHDLICATRAEVKRGRMTEHLRREPEIDLLLEAVVNVGSGFPDEYLHKLTATRFFEFVGVAARCMLTATNEFHPVQFRALLNDGWFNLGRAEEVGYSIEGSHESAKKAGKGNERRSTKELRAALLEGTLLGTIEEIAEKRHMTPRNVLFVKADMRRRQAK